MAIKDRLKAKGDEMKSEYSDVEGGTMLVSVIVCIVCFSVIVVGVFMLPPLSWFGFGDTDLGTGVGIGVLIVVVVAGIFLPAVYVERWMGAYWNKHHAHAWRWLKHTDMALLVMEPGRWEPLHEILDAHPWMKLSGTRQCKTLDEQIEMASDYQLAMMLIMRRRQRGMLAAVGWGSATRLADDIAAWFLGSCGVLLFLIIGGLVLYFPLLPFWILWLGLYIRRQAWQTALIEYFLDDKPKGYSQLKPPQGVDD